jgi:hypothetical protein
VGFDCTLHVVDEASLERFVDRFLGRTSEKAPFDRAFPDAEALVQKTKEILAGPDPARAGRILGVSAHASSERDATRVLRGFRCRCGTKTAWARRCPFCRVGGEPLGPIIDAHPAPRTDAERVRVQLQRRPVRPRA